MEKSQRGIGTLILIIILVIVISLGFIAFKLYIEPAKIPAKNQSQTQDPQVMTRDSFSKPTTQSETLANPASVNCGQKGGILKIMENGSGAEFGLCQFEDNQACEEWAFMRGECPPGGVKTIGFDNDQQAYCAWLGGQTEASENAVCTLPGDKTCSVDALWNGQCN